jgi:glycosyltransferase involved in cell wall biosynthesis
MTTAAAVAKVSVVTPVFNGAEFLDECIESVLAQTYPHWDHVLIDNCSTDGSLEIMRRHARSEPRIRVVQAEEFLGQVANFNRALRLIASDSTYTKMLLADDWMFPRCLEEMVALAESNPRVGVVGSYSMYRNRVHHHGLPFSRTPVFPGRWTVAQYIVEDHNFIGSPTAVMFRSDIVRARDPFYRDDTPVEDVEACLEVLAENDFGFVFQVLTGNRRDNVGVWSGMQDNSPDMLNDYLLAHRLADRFMSIEQRGKRLRDIDNRYYAMLGRAWADKRPTSFWAYHEKWMAQSGITLDMARVRRAAWRCRVGRMVDLKGTLKSLRGRG